MYMVTLVTHTTEENTRVLCCQKQISRLSFCLESRLDFRLSLASGLQRLVMKLTQEATRKFIFTPIVENKTLYSRLGYILEKKTRQVQLAC